MGSRTSRPGPEHLRRSRTSKAQPRRNTRKGTAPKAQGLVDDLQGLAFPVDRLTELPGNPRRGDVAAVARSYATFGQRKPIVARREGDGGIVIAGNHQLAAAKELGWEKIAVVWVDDDDVTAKAFALADNRTADLGQYDDAELVAMLQRVHDADAELFAATAYDEAFLAGLIGERELDADRDTDAGEPPTEPTTCAGDVIALGKHRLLCGDATVDQAQLMDGEVADLLLTDPPYGVDYVGKTAETLTINNDNIVGLPELLSASLRAACDASRPGASAYIFHAGTHGHMTCGAFTEAGWDLKQILVWVKQHFVLGRQDYQWKHEPVLYGWKPGAAHHWCGDFDKTTVIDEDVDVDKMTKAQLLAAVKDYREREHTTVLRHDRPMASRQHPTMKPVGLLAALTANSSQPENIVLDPFAGSGSVLIACENLKRRCYAMEIDPGYCDVIVDRWERHTGQTACRPAR